MLKEPPQNGPKPFSSAQQRPASERSTRHRSFLKLLRSAGDTLIPTLPSPGANICFPAGWVGPLTKAARNCPLEQLPVSKLHNHNSNQTQGQGRLFHNILFFLQTHLSYRCPKNNSNSYQRPNWTVSMYSYGN